MKIINKKEKNFKSHWKNEEKERQRIKVENWLLFIIIIIIKYSCGFLTHCCPMGLGLELQIDNQWGNIAQSVNHHHHCPFAWPGYRFPRLSLIQRVSIGQWESMGMKGGKELRIQSSSFLPFRINQSIDYWCKVAPSEPNNRLRWGREKA